VKPIYTAVNATAARAAFEDLAEKCGAPLPGGDQAVDNVWAEFIPFRGHFPSEQAAMKCLYLAIRSLDPTGRGRHDGSGVGTSRQHVRDHFADRFLAAETY
jgi:putative transposase